MLGNQSYAKISFYLVVFPYFFFLQWDVLLILMLAPRICWSYMWVFSKYIWSVSLVSHYLSYYVSTISYLVAIPISEIVFVKI